MQVNAGFQLLTTAVAYFSLAFFKEYLFRAPTDVFIPQRMSSVHVQSYLNLDRL